MTLPKKALVVDDEDYWRGIVLRALERLDCQVDLAHNLAEALAQLAVNRYDLVVSDYAMPKKGAGLQLLHWMRRDEANRTVPFILHTSDIEPINRDKAEQLSGIFHNKQQGLLALETVLKTALQ